jgi:hypothetical protein
MSRRGQGYNVDGEDEMMLTEVEITKMESCRITWLVSEHGGYSCGVGRVKRGARADKGL